MKIIDKKLIDRWDDVMYSLCLEHLSINKNLSEVVEKKDYYDVKNGISIDWMLQEAKYQFSCYYESGHCRCDDRFLGEEEYAIWRSETGKLKRLIAKLEKYDSDFMVVLWEGSENDD